MDKQTSTHTVITSAPVEVADKQQYVEHVGASIECRVGVKVGVGKQQVRSMGHFKQLLISEPCGESRHGKGKRKENGVYTRMSELW